MKAHRALGDGQTQSDPAGLTAAGIVDAIERPEEFVERFLGHAGAGVDDANDGFRTARRPGLRSSETSALVPSCV